MACSELNTVSIEADENITLASREPSPAVLGETSAPLHFFMVTPAQLGISTQSFNPSSSSSSSSSSNGKDKSRLAQLKARRRSAIGTRGSPETNALIRYIAQQRMKTPTTPEPVNASPFLPRVSSSRKQKMAFFQNLMFVEENEGSDLLPRQDSETGGCMKTRDYLSDGRSLDGGKENCPPPATPPPSKRRCTDPPRGCEGEIREATAPILKHIRRTEQKVDKDWEPQFVPPGPKPPNVTERDDSTAFFFPPLSLESPPVPLCELQPGPLTHRSPTKTLQGCCLVPPQEVPFELQSSIQLQPEDPAGGLPSQPLPPFPMPSQPPLLKMKPTGESDSSGNSAEETVAKKKRVRFGGLLSPELFDKNLPPSTPLQKGGTPAQAPTSAGGSQLRSVLKTPQRSESRDPMPQPDFGSPSIFGASPTLSLRLNHRSPYERGDDVELCEKITFPSMEENDSSFTDPAEGYLQTQPLDLNAAFQEESLTDTVTLTGATPESEVVPSEPPQIDAPQEPESPLGPQPEPETEPVIEAPAPAPVRSSSRKRKQPEESEPAKRSMRSAAKSAAGKMKKTSAKRQWGAKEVDRSLYGSRVYASKNPALSPVRESLSSSSHSPTPLQPRTRRRTAEEQEPSLLIPALGEVFSSDPITSAVTFAAQTHSCLLTNENIQETNDIITTDTWEVPSEAPAVSSGPDKRGAARKGRRRSGPKGSSGVERRASGAARRRTQGRKISVPIDAWLNEEPQHQPQNGGRLDEHREAQTTTNSDSTESSPSKYTLPGKSEVDTEDQFPRPPIDAPCTDTNGNAECHTSLDAPTTRGSPLAIEIANTVSMSEQGSVSDVKSIQNKATCGLPRGRSRSSRSTVNNSVLDEREEQAGQEEMHAKQGVEEKGQGDPASQVETSSVRSSSDRQLEEEEANQDLVSWQADFNLEDVFKPVATRGQRSVRRSLRNHSSNEDPSSSGSGLVWLPRTSPDSIREVRRRTRGRRLSATLPLQPPLPEEPDQ